MGCATTATCIRVCAPSHPLSNGATETRRHGAMKRILCIAALIAVAVPALHGDDSDRLLTIDHYVRVTSTVPAIAGQPAQLYVRERVLAGGALRASSFGDRV